MDARRVAGRPLPCALLLGAASASLVQPPLRSPCEWEDRGCDPSMRRRTSTLTPKLWAWPRPGGQTVGMDEPPKTPPWLSPPTADRASLDRLRHCWVVADEHGWVPALLLEWREAPDGWEGRVVRPVLDEHGEWRPREEWLPAEQLEA